MQNCKSSAQTAAKYSSKSSLLFRLPCILAMLLLCAVYCQAQTKKDTVRVLILYTDTTYKAASIPTISTFVLSVRELHNTSDGVMDSGGQSCIDDMGNSIPCWNDYWKHIYYLSLNKKPLNKNWVIWQSVSK